MPEQAIEEEINLTINIKKLILSIWSRRKLIVITWITVLALFIALTFVLPKKYTVNADLYINKSNNTNLAEFNPYIIEEYGSESSIFSSAAGAASLINEIELMKSPLVIDKVIRENDIRYKKKFGIFPNKKEGEYISTEVFLGKGKNLLIKEKPSTSIIQIEYKSKKADFAYNVVNSLVKNYIELHKQLNSEKSKSDIEILQKEYDKIKSNLNKRVNESSGLPETAIAGSGNISAMSAFSQSAQKAVSNIKGQYIAGTKSKIDIQEDAAKAAKISAKLEWAKMVEEMSDSSKVLILKKPELLRDFEYSSPKLLTNIFFGMFFGLLASIIAVIFRELHNKKLTYSMLDNNIIYDLEKEFIKLKSSILMNKDKKIGLINFEPVSADISNKLETFKNIEFINPDVSEEFVTEIKNIEFSILLAKINKTDSNEYKLIKNILKNYNKKVIEEITV